MTKLVWDQVGERRYETGIDRGVLYLPDGRAVVWNGLTSVNEVVTREVKNYYMDGIQYLAHHVPGGYSAKVQAFTYPDEMDQLTGIAEHYMGVFLHDQRSRMFNLVYRTLIGNDIDGTDYAYKIHVLWNVLATPSDRTYGSLSDDVAVSAFEWTLTAVPSQMVGARPTSHVSVDSRTLDPALLEGLENNLYGTETTEPFLLDTVEFLNSIQYWAGTPI